MQAVILAIISLVGPVLVEWLKKWLEDLLQRAAADLPDNVESYSQNGKRVRLFAAAIERHRKDFAAEPWWKRPFVMGRYRRREKLLERTREAVLNASHDGREYLMDDEAKAIADAAMAS